MSTQTEQALSRATEIVRDAFDSSSRFRVDGSAIVFRGVCRIEGLQFFSDAGGRSIEGNLAIVTAKAPLDSAGVDLRPGRCIHYSGRRWVIRDLSNGDDATEYHIECDPANQTKR